MAVIILKRHGLDELEPVARFEDGEWTDADEEFTTDDYYADQPEEVLLSDYDGPDYFAISEEDYQG